MGVRLRHHTASPRSKSESGGRILGIDPGSMVTGWGVVEMVRGKPRYLAHGTIGSPSSDSQQSRLSRIYRGLQKILSVYQPEGVSLEKVFFARNAQSALKLGQVRGVALLAAAENNLPVYEYASAEIKLAAVGYGQATKEQVQKMVASLLDLSATVPQDAADALAAAICHLHQQLFHARVLAALPQAKPAGPRWKIP